jgi:hypothetical protein
MSNSKPPFRSIVVLLTTLAILLSAAGAAYHSLMGGGSSSYEYLLPIWFVILLLGGKLAAPRIPWLQIAALVVVVFGVHFFGEHFPPFMLVDEKITEVICVFGFGAYWVAKGYISKETIRW